MVQMIGIELWHIGNKYFQDSQIDHVNLFAQFGITYVQVNITKTSIFNVRPNE